MVMPAGISREQRRNLTNLARHLRDTVDYVGLAKRIEALAFGRNPDTGEAVDDRTSLMAAQMLYDRGYGQAPQLVVLEGQLRSEQTTAPGEAFAKMSRAELEERRNRLLAAKARKVIVDV